MNGVSAKQLKIGNTQSELKTEEILMDYMKLLQNIRDNAQQAAEAKRRLMAASQSSVETDEWKRRYMRCQGEFERDRETAREIIRNAKDPEVMRLLYLRKVKNIPWSEAYRGLCSVRSEIDVWLAVSRYLRENYQNWTAYSDCL